MTDLNAGRVQPDRSAPALAEKDEDHWYNKLAREAYVFGAGTVWGAVKEGKDAVVNHPNDTGIKLAQAAGIGLLLNLSRFGPTPVKVAGALASTYLGVQVYRDMADPNRWNKLGEAWSDTWNSGKNTDRNFGTVQNGLGHLAFDSVVMVAGAKFGSKVADLGVSGGQALMTRFRPAVSGPVEAANLGTVKLADATATPTRGAATETQAANITRLTVPAEARLVETASTVSVSGPPEVFSYAFDRQFVAMRAPQIVADRSGFTRRTNLNFDSADEIGRMFTHTKPPLAAVIRQDTGGAFNFGSGVAVRPDGLVVATAHTLDGARGDIFVRLMNQPVATYRVRVLDIDPVNDLVLLKPHTPLPGTVAHASPAMFADRVLPNARLMAVGVPNVTADITGRIVGGDQHIALGRLIERQLCHYRSGPKTDMYRTTIPLDDGMSGGGAYEAATGQIAGLSRGGEGRTTQWVTGKVVAGDVDWTTLVPSDKVKAMILRNWHR